MVLTEQLLFGFISSLIGGLGAYVLLVEKRHRKERKEMQEAHQEERRQLIEMNEKHFEKLSEISEENNKVQREHINILSGLKTLLENQRRNGR